ncbi:PmeII family type II restriction endonuclease [Methanofollis tationis]|uniref:Type II restriction endonuclease EcoO109IR domain-containing protein n=1 Tax=Methanofollis tationis TaxID=81417 RepID=A0A7K4HKL9_9EURY|nr:PmeII family type II restriction endonuclease [Methanofollis tationis]NVO65824.1 hypothetical protein [Methanofollis tationis]
MVAKNSFYRILKSKKSVFETSKISDLFSHVDKERVDRIAESVSVYIRDNLPKAFDKRENLADYRTNPYVLLTSASVLDLDDPARFADFIFNSKFYMALETSFGKSIESAFVGQYPINSTTHWEEPLEKIAEFKGLEGFTREEKAQKRVGSVWREIDKSVVVGDHRYFVTIKSGPNTINDSQVQAMTDAIRNNYKTWINESKRNNRSVKSIDVVVGLTYGTDKTTNNKENQILAKLLDNGFVEEDRERCPGVLIDRETRTVRVYRKIGIEYWAFMGSPTDPSSAQHVFLEILLGLSKALSIGIDRKSVEGGVNKKIRELSMALSKLQFPQKSLPTWIKNDFSEEELFLLTTAMTAFYDEGI